MLRELKYRILNRKGILNKPEVDYLGDSANTTIVDALISPTPTMIARFGAFELGMALSVYTPLNAKNLIKLTGGVLQALAIIRNWPKVFAIMPVSFLMTESKLRNMLIC